MTCEIDRQWKKKQVRLFLLLFYIWFWTGIICTTRLTYSFFHYLKIDQERSCWKLQFFAWLKLQEGVQKNDFWIGLSDRKEVGKFTWNSGHKHAYNITSRWASGQPQNNDEHCVEINLWGDDLKMHDYPCQDKHRFVCQKRHRGGKC